MEEPKTEQELKDMQERNDAFIEERLPSLRKQAEYEKLRADISESQFRRLTILHKLAEYNQQVAKANAEMAEHAAKGKEGTNEGG